MEPGNRLKKNKQGILTQGIESGNRRTGIEPGNNYIRNGTWDHELKEPGAVWDLLTVQSFRLRQWTQ